ALFQYLFFIHPTKIREEGIYKELNFKPIEYIAQATLENGVNILIREDGSADGSDGKTYYNVSKETGDTVQTVGWTNDAGAAILL
ncbi:MAG: hypothetical protein ACI4I5_10240, partial [Acutalibacteraceae bacterium]